MGFELAFVLLFTIASGVAILARRLRVPYTVALVVAGLVLGAAHAFPTPHLTKELLFAVILPGLLFEAAFHVEFGKFWENKLAIHSLAIPGVVISVALTAGILTAVADALDLIQGFTFVHGLVFGAIIAATDPIAVIGIFKTLGAPKRLAILVEGESLLNDGTAVVFFTMTLAIANGGAFSPAGAVLEFVKVVGMGTLIGAAIGFGVSQVVRRVDDAMVEITLTVIAAYGSFVAAEHFHYSGVIATVVAGMLCGNYAARSGMSPSTRVSAETFWEYIAFALNSIVFLLIGLEVNIESLVLYWKPILAAFGAVMAARFFVTFAVSALLRRSRERIPWSWTVVLSWGGLRGGLSMVLALGLAADFPHRELFVHTIFGVVILSILGQGLTMKKLLSRLGVTSERESRVAYETLRGRLEGVRAALGELELMSRGRVQEDVAEELRVAYAAREEKARTELHALRFAEARLREEELYASQRHLLKVERDAIQRAFHAGEIGQDAMEHLLADVDARAEELEGAA